MTRMIERWFPCSEVSEASAAGWGSGNTERNLFTWFAARPTAQAKAAVITSLLPWPDNEAEQRRLQDLVLRAMRGRYEAWVALREEILASNQCFGAVLDPFSGRGMIPLEAARLGLPSYALDYSPVAVLASELLVDYPFRDWSSERSLPFAGNDQLDTGDRLIADLVAVLREVGERHLDSMADFYPIVGGKRPWGYLWAVTLPCQECGNRFPLVGSLELRRSASKKGDAGQSFYVEADSSAGTWHVVVHEGAPRKPATLVAKVGPDGKKGKGKSAVCPFCEHSHPLAVHQRLAGVGLGEDHLLLVSDLDDEVGKRYREPTEAELDAVVNASNTLASEPPFAPRLPAVPDELIPQNNGATVRPQLYGALRYGDLMVDRQTLAFVRLARVIGDVSSDFVAKHGLSEVYARALSGYTASVMVRKLRRATRGCTLDVARNGVHDIFVNEGTIAYSYDFFGEHNRNDEEPDGRSPWHCWAGSKRICDLTPSPAIHRCGCGHRSPVRLDGLLHR
jgi:adenine-specific DNA methylase